MTASSLQTRFARSLLDPLAPPPEGLVAWNGSDPARRFAVYRNNVMVSLIDALRDKFPVVNALVGDDFFAGVAAAYIAVEPPRSPILARYGDTFGAFVATFEPARALPYLADMARLEAMQLRAYHAADAVALQPDAFGMLAGDDLDGLLFALHPTVGIMSSDFAVFSLWAAHNGLADIGDVDPLVPEAAVVARPRLEVQTSRLGAGGAEFFLSLAAGRPLWRAVETARAAAASFDLEQALRVLVAAGVATSISRGTGELA